MTEITLKAARQLSIFDPPTGEELRDHGIEQATRHANDQDAYWSERAFEFLKQYIVDVAEFQTEDVRHASIGQVPEPPCLRAWGSVIRRAAQRNLIAKVGIAPVTNPAAHCANAAVWRAVV
jgi:hypothetical protein